MYNKLEKKLGRFAIRGLMKYVVIVYIAGFIVNLINPYFYVEWLMLDIDKILHGQVWRLLTFIIQPMEDNIIFMALMCYIYYSIGTSLEHIWGTFRFNLFYFTGILFNILATVIIYLITYFIFGFGVSYPVSLEYLNLSMFLAFAAMFPEMQFLFMFLIPLKAKYLCWFYAGLMIYRIWDAFSVNWFSGMCTTIIIVASMANFLISFLSTRKYLSPANLRRRMQFKAAYGDGMKSTVQDSGSVEKKIITRHKCAVCGRTELDDPNLEFRFCSKCNGNYEYCSDHLFTHTHVD